MESSYESLEIVRIASGLRLFDADSYQRRYLPPAGVPLEPGLYIVHWPAHVTARRFDQDAVYRGPFSNLEQARGALNRLKESLLAQANVASPSPAGTSESIDAVANETASQPASAGLPRDPAPLVCMPADSMHDPESRIERSWHEESEFVAEWAIC